MCCSAKAMKARVAGLERAPPSRSRATTCGSVVLALVADEEDASLRHRDGDRPAAARPDCGRIVAVVGEPTLLDRTISLRGSRSSRSTSPGGAAHSSLPAEGVNAVTHLGRSARLRSSEADAALRGRRLVWLATVVAGAARRRSACRRGRGR